MNDITQFISEFCFQFVCRLGRDGHDNNVTTGGLQIANSKKANNTSNDEIKTIRVQPRQDGYGGISGLDANIYTVND